MKKSIKRIIEVIFVIEHRELYSDSIARMAAIELVNILRTEPEKVWAALRAINQQEKR